MCADHRIDSVAAEADGRERVEVGGAQATEVGQFVVVAEARVDEDPMIAGADRERLDRDPQQELVGEIFGLQHREIGGEVIDVEGADEYLGRDIEGGLGDAGDLDITDRPVLEHGRHCGRHAVRSASPSRPRSGLADAAGSPTDAHRLRLAEHETLHVDPFRQFDAG